jgi:hypothetical protein
VPLSRTRSEAFDDLVLDAVEDLEQRWASELASVQFAVEDVPEPLPAGVDFDRDVVADHGVPLGRLYREGLDARRSPVIIVYRRPVEARSGEGEDRSDLVFAVVTELVAELLGRDVDEIDPSG